MEQDKQYSLTIMVSLLEADYMHGYMTCGDQASDSATVKRST
jgi:hypothetical protein